MLFALRFERDGRTQVGQLLQTLGGNIQRNTVRAIESSDTCTSNTVHQDIVMGLVRMASESKRTGDLFGNKTIFSKAAKMVGGLKGVDNGKRCSRLQYQ